VRGERGGGGGGWGTGLLVLHIFGLDGVVVHAQLVDDHVEDDDEQDEVDLGDKVSS